LSLPSIGQEDLFSSKRDITSYPGFICNRSNHWFAIRLIGSQFWNLDSMLEKPETISHFRLAAELEAWKSVGYIVFVVTQDLPPPDRSSGDAKDWWRIEDLKQNTKNVTTKSSTKTKQTDWKVTGIGRRLDGKQLDHETGLTEEELLKHAIQASIMPDVVVEEPSVDAPNVVSIQLRLEGGKRLIRRFTSDQLVWAIFSFCEHEMGGHYPLKLRYGFPPKDLSLIKDLTIGEAKLNGESIQVTNR
jgi:Ataxin-3